MSKQSKRAKFYDTQRWVRAERRITLANRHKPGFVGVSRGMRINGKMVLGPGAIFITRDPI